MSGSYEKSAKLIEKLMTLYETFEISDNERTAAYNALLAARAMVLRALEEEQKEFDSHRYDGYNCQFDTNDLPY